MFKILRYTFNTKKLWLTISEMNYSVIDYMRAVYFSAWGTLLITLTIKFSSYSYAERIFILIAFGMAVFGAISCTSIISKLKIYEQIYIVLEKKEPLKVFINEYGYKQLFPDSKDYNQKHEKALISKQHRTHNFLLRGWYLPFLGIAFFLGVSSISFSTKSDSPNILNEKIIIDKIDDLNSLYLKDTKRDSVLILEIETLRNEIKELKDSLNNMIISIPKIKH